MREVSTAFICFSNPPKAFSVLLSRSSRRTTAAWMEARLSSRAAVSGRMGAGGSGDAPTALDGRETVTVAVAAARGTTLDAVSCTRLSISACESLFRLDLSTVHLHLLIQRETGEFEIASAERT